MYKYYLLGVYLLCFACKAPVDILVPIDDREFLVVDGFISTEQTPHRIYVGRTRPFLNEDIFRLNGVPNAIVSILDKSGNCTELINDNTGYYHTPPSFQAHEGNTYEIRVTIEDKIYKSAPEKILPKINIPDIRFEGKLVEVLDNKQIIEKAVIDYFVDLELPNDQTYVILDWTVDFEHYTQILGVVDVPIVCYGKHGEPGFSETFTNVGLNTKSVRDFQFERINLTWRFDPRQIMEVKCYSANQQAHDFHTQVLAQQNLTGSVFDPTPYQINGNISSITDPEELVFGYFGAFNCSKKKILFNLTDVHPLIPQGICTDPPPEYCFDCRLVPPGLSTEPPYYWDSLWNSHKVITE